ncbi:HXXXD-type acyl-transferase family protein [Prunus dulcis]|uniref:HXXXD-type acyl-transferase family protein n=1 Tax=Prunus dulcis TaxID=3755 RepID=A0A4Y1RTU9_PRUDU|nr:HXXXD-type acyl-transferase family protein [Prunus dulcis]
MKAGEVLERGLGFVAWEMNNMVALQTEEKLRSFLECWVQEPKLLTEDNMAANALVTSSSPRFNVNGNDFGWERPVGVRNGVGNKSHGKITVFAGVEEGSIDIEACLLAETLEAMGNDSEFMDVDTV